MATGLAQSGCSAAEDLPPTTRLPIATAAPAAAWTLSYADLSADGAALAVLDFATVPAEYLILAATTPTGVSVISLDPSTGHRRWQRGSDSWVSCQPVESAKQVACFGGTEITVLNAQDGSIAWRFSSSAIVQDLLVFDDGAVVLAYPDSDDAPSRIVVGRVESSGSVTWNRTALIVAGITNLPRLSANTASGLVSAGAVMADGTPAVLTLATGELWVADSHGTPTLLAGGQVALNHPDGTAVVNPDGQLVVNRPGEIRVPASADRPTADLPLVFAEEFNGAVGLAAYSKIGAQQWQLAGFDAVASYCGGRLLVTSEHSHTVAAVDPASGKIAWTRTITPEEGVGFQCDGRHVIVQTADSAGNGAVMWLRVSSGDVAWTVKPEAEDWDATMTSAGLVVTSAAGVTLYR